MRGRDVESLICAPIGIHEKVGERLVKGPDRAINVVLEDKK
jgi:hypothetical protein